LRFCENFVPSNEIPKKGPFLRAHVILAPMYHIVQISEISLKVSSPGLSKAYSCHRTVFEPRTDGTSIFPKCTFSLIFFQKKRKSRKIIFRKSTPNDSLMVYMCSPTLRNTYTSSYNFIGPKTGPGETFPNVFWVFAHFPRFFNDWCASLAKATHSSRISQFCQICLLPVLVGHMFATKQLCRHKRALERIFQNEHVPWFLSKNRVFHVFSCFENFTKVAIFREMVQFFEINVLLTLLMQIIVPTACWHPKPAV
jgi:hypothetical protein